MKENNQKTLRMLGAVLVVGAFVVLTTAGATPEATDRTPPMFPVGDHADEAGTVHVPDALRDAADPVAWAVDAATGLRHRITTTHEREANDWPAGSMLVEAHAGTPDAPALAIPVPGQGLRMLDFHTPFSLGEVTAVTQTLDGATTTRTLETTRWMYDGPDGVFRLFTGSDGGLHANGYLGALRLDVFGHEPDRILDDLPGAPERVFLVVAEAVPELDGTDSHCPHPLLNVLCSLIGLRPQCSDGVDNDGDNWVDWPSDPGCSSSSDDNEVDSRFTNYFGMFGETKWCTRNSANWATLASALASDIDAGFDANGGTRANLVHAISHCWTAASQSDATTCDTSGGCSDGSGHTYPFNGCNGSSTCYRDNAWSDVSHARLHSSFLGLKVVQVVHDGLMDSGSLCGLSRFPGSGITAGDSVALGSIAGTGCKGYVWTHEVGHSFNAIHGEADPAGTCHTVMKQSSASTCRVNYFSNDNRKRVNDCVVNSWCPRSGTG